MGGGLRELGPTPERRLPELHRSACCHTSNGALTSIRETFLANSHSKDSHAPNTSGSRSRAQGEGSRLSTRINLKSLKCSAIRYLSKSVRNFELRRRKECKEFDAEAASKLRLPKQHLPTDRDRGAMYRGKKKIKKISQTKLNKIATTKNQA